MRTIIFYRTESGISPIEEFLDALPGKDAQKVVWVLKIVEELDIVPKQYFKKLTGTDDIWEIRVQSRGKIYRILCFIDDGKAIILTNAFIKKSKKILKKEIQIAENRKHDYLRRKHYE